MLKMLKKAFATFLVTVLGLSQIMTTAYAGGGGPVLNDVTYDCNTGKLTYDWTMYAGTAGDYQVYYYVNGITVDSKTYNFAAGSTNDITEEFGGGPSEPDTYSAHVTVNDPDGGSAQSEYITFSTDCSQSGGSDEGSSNSNDSDSSKHKQKVFSEDKRCHAATPGKASWVKFNGKELLWSAKDGEKIEVRFSEKSSDLRWSFVTSNDGHEILGQMRNTGKMSGKYYFQMRTLNGCKSGPWSETFVGYF